MSYISDLELRDWSAIPKAVWCNIAVSLAVRLSPGAYVSETRGLASCSSDEYHKLMRQARDLCVEEWYTLYANGVVKQKPRVKRRTDDAGSK